MGSEDCPISEDMEDIEYSMSYRIPKIEALEKCVNLVVRKPTANFLETRIAQKSDNKNRRLGKQLQTRRN